jgi:hypothetical protein
LTLIAFENFILKMNWVSGSIQTKVCFVNEILILILVKDTWSSWVALTVSALATHVVMYIKIQFLKINFEF